MLLSEKSLTSNKHKDLTVKYEVDIENDAYKFLGAYIGNMTALHYSILTGHDAIAKDIIERTLKDDLDATYGVFSIDL